VVEDPGGELGGGECPAVRFVAVDGLGGFQDGGGGGHPCYGADGHVGVRVGAAAGRAGMPGDELAEGGFEPADQLVHVEVRVRDVRIPRRAGAGDGGAAQPRVGVGLGEEAGRGGQSCCGLVFAG
jgi:hypothetical protein